MSSRPSVSSSSSTAVRLAEEYLVRGDLREALSIYRVISEAEPGNASIKSRLGELCALADKNSPTTGVLVEVARIHLGQGNMALAIAALNKASKLFRSADPDTLMDLAGLCRKCGLRADAERYYLIAADIYERTGRPEKQKAAYESAAVVAPANAEIQMKLGVVCHQLRKLEDSYRAFMKAAAEFNKRGDESAALDAYGHAVKVSLAGAEAGNAMPESMTEQLPAEQARSAERTGPINRRPQTMSLSQPVAPVEGALPRHRVGRPDSKPESAENEPVARKIATAEMVFGFGRPDRAIALLKEMLEQDPNDPRIHLKLKDMYLRSRMPEEAAAVYRELARIYMAEGKSELAGGCLASAQRLSSLGADLVPEASATPASTLHPHAGEPARILSPSHRAATTQALTHPGTDDNAGEKAIRIRTAGRAADSPITAAFGARLRAARAKTENMGRRRYLVAGLVALAMLVTIGAYLHTRSNRSTTSAAPEIELTHADAAPPETPAADTGSSIQVEPPDGQGGPAQGQGDVPASQTRANARDSASQRQQQSAAQPQASTPSQPEEAPAKKPDQPRPTPPPVGPIAGVPGTSGGGLNLAPGALSTQVSPPEPPPTATPIRRSAVVAGGDVLRRVSPVYPQAARAAHISGTVTVELSINEEGNVVAAKATSGPVLLAGAAESAARGFKFKPMTLNGAPIKSNRTVLFHFKE